MSKDTVPPQVKDEDKRTKVFDWRVPIRVGSQPAQLTGTLFWQPATASGVPTAAIVALVVLVAGDARAVRGHAPAPGRRRATATSGVVIRRVSCAR